MQTKFWLFIFSCLVIFLFGYAAWSYSTTRNFLSRVTATEGTVVEIARRPSSNTYVYAPVIRFQDASGNTVQFTSKAAASAPQYSVGNSIKILYRTDAPEDVRVDSFFAVWGTSFIPVLCGLFWSLFVIIIIAAS